MPENILETIEVFIEDCRILIEKYQDGSKFSKKQIVATLCQP